MILKNYDKMSFLKEHKGDVFEPKMKLKKIPRKKKNDKPEKKNFQKVSGMSKSSLGKLDYHNIKLLPTPFLTRGLHY